MSEKLVTIGLLWGVLLAVALIVLEILKTISLTINYPFLPIYDILLLIVIIGFLLIGTKQYRDKVTNGVISYPKAFGVGAVIAIVSSMLFLGYLMIHFQFFDTQGIDRINNENRQRFIEKVEKDTIHKEEMVAFLNFTKEQTNLYKTETLSLNAKIDSLKLTTHIDSINAIYQLRILGPVNKSDTNNYSLKNFSRFAKRTLWEVTDFYLSPFDSIEALQDEVNSVIAMTQNDISKEYIMEQRLLKDKDKIPFYASIYLFAFVRAFLIFCYTIFFDIFTSLYLYKRKTVENNKEINN